MINSTKGDLDNFFSLHMLITRLNFHFESFWLSQSRFDGISILILIFDYYNIVELNVKNFNGRDTVLKKKYFRVCEFSPFYLSFFYFYFFFFFVSNGDDPQLLNNFPIHLAPNCLLLPVSFLYFQIGSKPQSFNRISW